MIPDCLAGSLRRMIAVAVQVKILKIQKIGNPDRNLREERGADAIGTGGLKAPSILAAGGLEEYFDPPAR